MKETIFHAIEKCKASSFYCRVARVLMCCLILLGFIGFVIMICLTEAGIEVRRHVFYLPWLLVLVASFYVALGSPLILWELRRIESDEYGKLFNVISADDLPFIWQELSGNKKAFTRSVIQWIGENSEREQFALNALRIDAKNRLIKNAPSFKDINHCHSLA
jgi:hypothetical protein